MMEHKANYPELFFLFFAGSIAGFILEGIWRVIRTGVWENHSATVYGPFCIVYGFGAAALYWFSGEFKDLPLWEQFLLYALIGAAVEYFASFIQESVFGSVSWDYSDRLLNLNGRVCLSMTLMWGLLGMVFSTVCYPAAESFFSLTANWPVQGLCFTLSIIMAADLILSGAAIIRWRDRQDNIPPRNVIGERLDEHFDDERMEEIYNNMVFLDNADQAHH